MAEVRQVTAEELEQELAREDCCVVEFWMVGCPACSRFAPIFAQLAEEMDGRISLVTVEARENMEAAKKHGIRGVPTVIVIRDGEEVQRTTGAKSLEEMREWLEPALV